jgi:hypothetical protein
MHRGFQVLSLPKTWGNKYASMGESVRSGNRARINEALEKYTNANGSLDAASLSKRWFPLVQSDVFISHSHENESEALGMAGWLKTEFGLHAFVDSTVWKSADGLLKEIDDNHCVQDDGNYNYRKRNRSTSHVHMMLAMAIAEMIDNSECLFFLNTPDSISPQKTIEGDHQTSSPWIYAEIAISRIVRERPLPASRRDRLQKSMESRVVVATDSVDIVHPLNVRHLAEIGESQLLAWQYKCEREKSEHPLDLLYEMVPRRASGI